MSTVLITPMYSFCDKNHIHIDKIWPFIETILSACAYAGWYCACSRNYLFELITHFDKMEFLSGIPGQWKISWPSRNYKANKFQEIRNYISISRKFSPNCRVSGTHWLLYLPCQPPFVRLILWNRFEFKCDTILKCPL